MRHHQKYDPAAELKRHARASDACMFRLVRNYQCSTSTIGLISRSQIFQQQQQAQEYVQVCKSIGAEQQ